MVLDDAEAVGLFPPTCTESRFCEPSGNVTSILCVDGCWVAGADVDMLVHTVSNVHGAEDWGFSDGWGSSNPSEVSPAKNINSNVTHELKCT